jgi:hypothetical protein
MNGEVRPDNNQAWYKRCSFARGMENRRDWTRSIGLHQVSAEIVNLIY